MRAARSLAAACVVVATGFGGAAGDVAAHADQCPGVKTTGHWATIKMPTWPSSPAYSARAESGYSSDSLGPANAVVDPSNSSRLFVSDGEAVMRSTNGGCTWQLVFTLAPTGAPTDGTSSMQPWADPSYVIHAITVSGTGSTAHVYLALTAGVGYAGGIVNTDAVYVAASENAGTSWTTHEVVVGSGPQASATSTSYTYLGTLMAAPTSPRTIYWDAVFYGSVVLYGSSDHLTLLVSHDAGATWQVASRTSPGTAGSVSDHMSEVVDLANSHVLWRAYDPGTTSPAGLDVLRSTDAGVRYRPALTGQPPGEQTFDPPFVTSRPTGRGSCVVAHSSAVALRSTDVGGRWTRLSPVPALDARSGRGYLEGASCVASSRTAVLVGYQPQRYASPPFARSELYVQAGRAAWKRLAVLSTALGEGSLTVAGPSTSPAVYWFGLVSKPHPTPLPTDYIWLRYVGSLR